MKPKVKLLSIFLVLLALSGYGQQDTLKIEQDKLWQDTVNIAGPDAEETMELMMETVAEESQAGYNLIPPSPTVSSLGKYIETPVSLYTGVADVKIPIIDLKVGDISLPVNLSYHSGGIKVEELASFVGLGWSLNAGGVISRVVNGIPDEKGCPYTFIHPPHQMSPNEFERYYYYSTGDCDSQHDMFYYNFSNHSGKFVLDFEDDYSPVLLPQKNIKVEFPNFSISNTGTIIITSPDGIKYTFDQTEQITNFSNCTDGSSNYIDPYTNAWYLSKIESAVGGHYINFSYNDEVLSYTTKSSETNYIPLGMGTKPDMECFNEILSYAVKRISKIETSNGITIDFFSETERCDLSDDYMLNRIVIRNGTDTLKKYVLNHKYLEGNQLKELSLFNPSLEENNANLRLILTSVDEFGFEESSGTYSDLSESTVFSYWTDLGLPSRFSNAQDLYGYYNGIIQNSTLVPSSNYGGYYRDGAIRTTSLEHARQGTLKQIQHKTEGTTNYNYELNECRNYTFTYYLPPGPANIESHVVDKYSVDEIPFEVTSQNGYNGYLEMSFSESDYCYLSNCKIELYLYRKNEFGNFQPVFSSWEYPNESYIKIPFQFSEGEYKLVKVINDPDYLSEIDNFYLKAYWELPSNPNTIVNKIVGGLRIKQISSDDLITGKPKIRNYFYENGYLSSFSKFSEIITIPSANYCEPGGYPIDLWAWSSFSSLPLVATQGGHVGYGKVKVVDGENDENGYTINEFYTSNDHPDYLINPVLWHGDGTIELGSVEAYIEDQWERPYPMLDSKDWKRGLIKKSVSYDANDEKISSTHYTYKFYDDATQPYYDVEELLGVKVVGNPVALCDGDPEGYLKIAFYIFRSSRYELVGQIDSLFSGDGVVRSETSFEYEENPRHFLPVKSTQTNSDGKIISTLVKYPSDPSSGAPAQMYDEDNVNYKHMLSPIVEKKIEVNGQPVSKVHTNYIYDTGKGMVLPDDADIYPTGNSTTYKIHYSHNDDGNIVEQYKEDDVKTAYLWDNTGTYVMAKVENAAYSQISSQDGKACTYSSLTLYNSLKTLVSDAMITTYTHKPLVGVAQQTDPAGRTTYYEYDDFGRLELVRDQNNNIVTKNEYHYAE